MFDLDYVDDEYTVDAAHYGNISHFVNHSVSVIFFFPQCGTAEVFVPHSQVNFLFNYSSMFVCIATPYAFTFSILSLI